MVCHRIERNTSSYRYSRERVFDDLAGCSCVGDVVLKDEQVDAAKVTVVENGEVIANVDPSGITYVAPIEAPPETKDEATPLGLATENPATEAVATKKLATEEPAGEEPAAKETLIEDLAMVEPTNVHTAKKKSETQEVPQKGDKTAPDQKNRDELVEGTTEKEMAIVKASTTPVVPAPATAQAHRRLKAAPKANNERVNVDLTDIKRKLKSEGIHFIKHCTDGKIRKRTLVLSEDELMFGWKKNSPKKMVRFADVKEVRAATVIDPSTVGLPGHPNGLAGTEILRKTGEGNEIARRCFSFILSSRTIDVQCESEFDAKKLCAAFKIMVDKANKMNANA